MPRECTMCDVSVKSVYQIRVSEDVNFHGNTGYTYVCKECYNVSSLIEKRTPYGGYTLLKEDFERLREERVFHDLKEPDEDE